MLSLYVQKRIVAPVQNGPFHPLAVRAANSLLKTLEEPVANTFLILLSQNKQALLATIRSRCQIINIRIPAVQTTQQWLKEQGVDDVETLLSLVSGAPLKAKDMVQSGQLAVRNEISHKLIAIIEQSIDPMIIADEFIKSNKLFHAKTKVSKKNKQLAFSQNDVIYWFDTLVADLVKLHYNCAQYHIINIDLYQNLHQLSKRLYLNKLLQLSDSINKAYADIQSSINMNLLFEKLLIEWQACVKK